MTAGAGAIGSPSLTGELRFSRYDRDEVEPVASTAPAPEIDLEAERAASHARRDLNLMDTHARVLLHLAGPGARPGTIEEWCEYQHPNWTPERREALNARALELQTELASRSSATEASDRKPPTGNRVGDRDAIDDFSGADVEAPSPSVELEMSPTGLAPIPGLAGYSPMGSGVDEFREQATRRDEAAASEPKKLSAADARKSIRKILEREPEIRFSDCKAQVEEQHGVVINPGTFHGYWAAVREALGMSPPSSRKEGDAPIAAPQKRGRKAGASKGSEEGTSAGPAPASSGAAGAPPSADEPEAEPPATEPESDPDPLTEEEWEEIAERVREEEEEGAQHPAPAAALALTEPAQAPAAVEWRRSERDEIHLELDGEWGQLRVDIRFASPDTSAQAAAAFCRAMGIEIG